MPRNQTIVSALIELVMDIKDDLHELAILDGVICEDEATVMQKVDRALHKALAVENGQIIAKNVMDNGGIVENALRRDREFKADIANIVHIEDYRHADQPA